MSFCQRGGNFCLPTQRGSNHSRVLTTIPLYFVRALWVTDSRPKPDRRWAVQSCQCCLEGLTKVSLPLDALTRGCCLLMFCRVSDGCHHRSLAMQMLPTFYLQGPLPPPAFPGGVCCLALDWSTVGLLQLRKSNLLSPYRATHTPVPLHIHSAWPEMGNQCVRGPNY